MKIRLTQKVIIFIVISLLISSPISQGINLILKEYIDGSFGVFVNTLVNLIVVTILVITLLRIFIIKPLLISIQALQKIGNGTLQVELPKAPQDEIGDLIRAVNNMSNQLRKTVTNIQNATKEMANQNKGLSLMSLELVEMSEQISATTEQLAAGSEKQASSSIEMSNAMKAFGNMIDQIDREGKHLLGRTVDIMSVAEKGFLQLDKTGQKMNDIVDTVSISVNKVYLLDDKTKNITKIVKQIEHIAEQTKLLALNAAIEAARAGEHGNGFAVVANEVQSLAHNVAESLDGITQNAADIQTSFHQVVQFLNSCMGQVHDGKEEMEQSQTMFQGILSNIQLGNETIKAMTNHIQSIHKESQQLYENIDDIASISQESAAAIEEVSASIQQQNQSIQQVSHTMNSLQRISRELNEITDYFSWEKREK